MEYTLVCVKGKSVEYENISSFKDAVEAAEDEALYGTSDLVAVKRERDDFIYWSSSHSEELRKYESLSNEDWQNGELVEHNHSDKPSVYIDVDGTLAMWYTDGKGLSYPEEMLDPKNHYYRDLEPHKFIVDLAKELYSRGVDVCVLSATARECIPDRFEWIEQNLPFIPKENICLCPVGADKTKYCKGNAEKSVLIDDYGKNLDEWTGQAVKSINSVNSKQDKYPQIDAHYYETEADESEYRTAVSVEADIIEDMYMSAYKEHNDKSHKHGKSIADMSLSYDR